MVALMNKASKIKTVSSLENDEAKAVEQYLVEFDDSFFYGVDWIETAARELYPAGSVDYIIGRDGTGKISGFISIVKTRAKFLKLFEPNILALTGTRSVISPEHLDLPIGEKFIDEWSRFLTEYLEQNLKSCELAIFDSISDKSAGIKILIGLAEKAGYKIIKQDQDVCPYLDLPGDFDTLLSSFSANMRKITRRTLKRSEERFQLVDYSEIGDISKAFSAARKLHELSRNQKGDKSSFDRPRYLEFHQALAERLAKKGKLYFKFLVADGHPVAFRYGFLHRGVYYDYQTGYDPQYSKGRPGFLIMALVIKELIDLQIRRFDFLRGDEPYKKHWAIGNRRSYRYIIFGRSFKSRLYYNLFRLYTGFKK